MSGKRKPSTASNSISSDEEDVGRTLEKHDTSDTGYESVGSPGSVSTISVCSEQALEELRSSQLPTGPGLWPGAREATGARPKTQSRKKKNLLTISQQPEVSDETVIGTPKSRFRREPLPMKMRALPQSFWQQPNTNSTSPSSGSLPPLVTTAKDAQDLNEVRPVTPPECRGQARPEERTRTVTVGNTELLFSLFDGVDQASDRRRVAVIKRGRPKKQTSSLPRVSLDDDPYMSSSASDSILPLLPERTGGPGTPANRGTQILSVVQIPGGGDRESICLPSLSVEHNYSNILSQLVMKL
ncbi:uncharacterized protein LOC119097576 [Pollicipes pollicipes]|uniref:uncharacterized protein LOC119097576 n=1 Tax=Pollicipes pollicipes TaxID=41117 RepID=UPI0018852F37|nr:uncharacterized protein LOC119097576 [Pollicipes pollicipes]